MSEDNYRETPTKPCPKCRTKGFRKEEVLVFDKTPTSLLTMFIPVFRKCTCCDGWGYVALSDDEIYDNYCARKDWEAELMNDR